MNFDASPLRHQLTAALARYEQWERPLRKYRGQNTGRLNRGDFTWEQFDSSLRELEASLRAVHDPRSELHPLFAQLCAEFAAASPAQRDAMRAFVARQQKLGGLLWRYANHLAGSIASTGDAGLLPTALAAVALENCAADFRDTLMTLADLYVAAESAGIDPAAAFRQASSWATASPTPGGCESLAHMLREFPASSVLAERRGLPTPYGGPR
ncbi:MAG TPA: hypothetical protein VEQ85_07985 [Lacipirellulaceae bacterium]|nr:hypothetical protein [Lacipirellulaceae bacterium]